MSIFPTKILLVTDDSQDEQLARTTAIDMATATDSELHVLCIASGLPPYEGYLSHDTRSSMRKRVRPGGRQLGTPSARYGVDPSRVALMSRSAASQLALLTAYEGGRATPAPGCAARDVRDTGIAAVAAFYAPTDLSRLASMSYLPGMDRFVGGSLGAAPKRYRHLSPVSHVGPDDPPTFLAYGGDDQTVPPGQSELLGERLREAGVPHRLVELPWANHTFDFLWGGWGSQITRSTLKRFLESHL